MYIVSLMDGYFIFIMYVSILLDLKIHIYQHKTFRLTEIWQLLLSYQLRIYTNSPCTECT